MNKEEMFSKVVNFLSITAKILIAINVVSMFVFAYFIYGFYQALSVHAYYINQQGQVLQQVVKYLSPAQPQATTTPTK